MQKRSFEKVAIVRQEFYLLTNDTFLALMLNQLMFWTKGNLERNKWLNEEERRETNPVDAKRLKYGWIRKSADDIAEEAMISAGKMSIGRYMQKLIDMGIVARKKIRGTKGYEYRVMLLELESQLSAIGCEVPEILSVRKGHEQKKTTVRLAECGHRAVKTYASLYSEYKDRVHPNLKQEQFERVCKWFDDVQAEFDLFDDQVEDMIHSHFENLPQSNDGNINAFACGSVAQGPHRKYIGK
jgi:hypothetical protein